MVPTHSPGRETTVTIGTITRKPENSSLCTLIWVPRLQCTTIFTHWYGGFNPRETDTWKNIFRALQNAYVLGTSYEHYHYLDLWVNDTRATKVSGTILFKQKYITNPTVTPEDAVIAAATNLADALKNKIPHHLKEYSRQELFRLRKLFKEAITIENIQTKAYPTYLETDKKLGIEHQLNKNRTVSQPAPPFPKKTRPPPRVDIQHPRVYKPIQQSEPQNQKPQPPPMTILPRQPPIFAADTPKMKDATFKMLKETKQVALEYNTIGRTRS